ncbi:ribosomal protein L7/L12 [Dactylosporangium sp. CS-033363]|uniref:ribosomal protein L7/L12 n=1 Tax=unclassified Dactylosporangium TaxID=2621675 RepID=UPI003D8B7F0C
MDADESMRLARLERQVAFLYRHFGLDPNLAESFPGRPAGMPPEFAEALRQNNLIAAIKIYRQVTGAGLKEAKDAVEALIRNA